MKFDGVIKSLSYMAIMTKSAVHLDLSETIYEGHVQKISDTFWPNCEDFTLMLFIATVLHYCKLKS